MFRKNGKITVLTGPMFSGKTESMVVRLKRANLARKHFLAFKPIVDSRSERSLEDMIAQTFQLPDVRHLIFQVSEFNEIVELIGVRNIDVIAFDEAQFFDSWIVDMVRHLAWEKGRDVIIAGLDLDYRRREFGNGHMSTLLSLADEVSKLTAICFRCGGEARFTQRVSGTQEQVQVGGKGEYEARCGKCFYEFGAEASF